MQFEAISNVSPNDARAGHFPATQPGRWKGVDKLYRVVGYSPERYASEAEFRSALGLGALDLAIPLGQVAARLDDGYQALALGLDPDELDAVGTAGKLSALRWFSSATSAFSGAHLRVLAHHAPALAGVSMHGAALGDDALQMLAEPTFLPALEVFHAINVPVSEPAVMALLKARPDVFWVFAPRATAKS